jgi:hypothetical protein
MISEYDYEKYKNKVISQLLVHETPNIAEYVTRDFRQKDFLNMIKQMESEGLIQDAAITRGGRGDDNFITDLDSTQVTEKGKQYHQNFVE